MRKKVRMRAQMTMKMRRKAKRVMGRRMKSRRMTKTKTKMLRWAQYLGAKMTSPGRPLNASRMTCSQMTRSRNSLVRVVLPASCHVNAHRVAGLTTYEKRMASLKEEIAALEEENVSQKHWTLMGEATTRSRPQNALLEEDLEFERVMKAVPVITEETVQGLEERIKARIAAGQFDDVVRKRPVDDKPFLPSRFFELQDTKSKQSLAEIYEDEYTAAKTGGVAGEDRDGKLKKEHDEIEKQWEQICAKLDALCNAHFTPKAVSEFANSILYTTNEGINSPRQPSPPSPTSRLPRWSLRCQRQRLRRRCLRPRKSLHQTPPS